MRSTLVVKHSNPQAHHLNYDTIIRNHEHWLQYGIHHSKYHLQKYFETCPVVSNLTTNYPKAHYKYLWKNPNYSLTKVHEEWKLMTNMCCLGCTQPGPKGLAHVSQPKPKKHQQEAKDWEWATSPCSPLTKKSN